MHAAYGNGRLDFGAERLRDRLSFREGTLEQASARRISPGSTDASRFEPRMASRPPSSEETPTARNNMLHVMRSMPDGGHYREIAATMNERATSENRRAVDAGREPLWTTSHAEAVNRLVNPRNHCEEGVPAPWAAATIALGDGRYVLRRFVQTPADVQRIARAQAAHPGGDAAATSTALRRALLDNAALAVHRAGGFERMDRLARSGEGSASKEVGAAIDHRLVRMLAAEYGLSSAQALHVLDVHRQHSGACDLKRKGRPAKQAARGAINAPTDGASERRCSSLRIASTPRNATATTPRNTSATTPRNTSATTFTNATATTFTNASATTFTNTSAKASTSAGTTLPQGGQPPRGRESPGTDDALMRLRVEAIANRLAIADKDEQLRSVLLYAGGDPAKGMKRLRDLAHRAVAIERVAHKQVPPFPLPDRADLESLLLLVDLDTNKALSMLHQKASKVGEKRR